MPNPNQTVGQYAASRGANPKFITHLVYSSLQLRQLCVMKLGRRQITPEAAEILDKMLAERGAKSGIEQTAGA